MIHTLLDFHQSTSAAQVLFNQKKGKKRNPRWFLRFITGMENAASQLPHTVAPETSLTNQKYRKRNKSPTKAGKNPSPASYTCVCQTMEYLYLAGWIYSDTRVASSIKSCSQLNLGSHIALKISGISNSRPFPKLSGVLELVPSPWGWVITNGHYKSSETQTGSFNSAQGIWALSCH